MGYTYSEKMIVPHEEIDLIYIAALEAILSTGTKKESDQLGSLEIETR
jgi:hypothetical protein